MAETVMLDLCRKHNLNWQIDSAGIASWNVDCEPESRCQAVLAENGLTTNHLGRQVNILNVPRTIQ